MTDLNKETYDKDKLTDEMNTKIRERLLSSDGIASLFIHNLENFAYRYLETSTDKEIKCTIDGDLYMVESIEPSVIEALKWDNAQLKKSLIDLCKKYPGKQSQELKVKLMINTRLVNSENVDCASRIECILPDGESSLLFEKKTQMKFEDPIELRNKHAALLEEVSLIF